MLASHSTARLPLHCSTPPPCSTARGDGRWKPSEVDRRDVPHPVNRHGNPITVHGSCQGKQEVGTGTLYFLSFNVDWLNTIMIHAAQSTMLEPRRNLGLCVLQRPLAPRLLAPDAIDLLPGEPLRYDGGVVAQAGDPGYLLVADVGRRAAVCALVHGHDDGAAET